MIMAQDVDVGLRTVEVEVRETGISLSGFVRQTTRRQFGASASQSPVARVPCGTCQACCWSKMVDVYPEEEKPEDLMHMDLEIRDGKLALRKRADGACVHLGPDGCSIYEHRPVACRVYDCRIFSAVGVCPDVNLEDGHHHPLWVFDLVTQEDKIMDVALRRGASQGIKAGARTPRSIARAAFDRIGENFRRCWSLALRSESRRPSKPTDTNTGG
jgi:hypothetical protein